MSELMKTTAGLKLPDFIGVGPPRTATTWLHEALTGHVGLPQGVKETDFFNWQYDKGLEWYAAHFRECPADLPIGEFSPNYFINPQAPERIAKDIPGCKIICTLRDPVERTYSHYRKMREGEYFSGTFEECLRKRLRLKEWSKYATYISVWRKHFGTDNVLALIQDDLKADPQMFLDQACAFIGIPKIEASDFASKEKLVNAVPNVARNPRLARAARRMRDGLQKRGNYGIVNLLKKAGIRDLLFSGGAAFEPLRPETAAKLREFFRPEVETLEQLLDRDLTAWKMGKTASLQKTGK